MILNQVLPSTKLLKFAISCVYIHTQTPMALWADWESGDPSFKSQLMHYLKRLCDIFLYNTTSTQTFIHRNENQSPPNFSYSNILQPNFILFMHLCLHSVTGSSPSATYNVLIQYSYIVGCTCHAKSRREKCSTFFSGNHTFACNRQ